MLLLIHQRFRINRQIAAWVLLLWHLQFPGITLCLFLAVLHLAPVEANFYSISKGGGVGEVEKKLHICFQQAGHPCDLYTP